VPDTFFLPDLYEFPQGSLPSPYGSMHPVRRLPPGLKLVAIGWLDGPSPFAQGETDPGVVRKLLGLDETPWIQRGLDIRLKNKEAGTKARTKAGEDRVPNTKPSHALADYVGDYENAAYGVMKIGLKANALQFDFHKIRMPMTHVHYDRFDTPDDEEDGKWSVNFRTNPQGDIEQAVMSLDEAEATFTRKPEKLEPTLLTRLSGSYETPSGTKIQIRYQESSGLTLVANADRTDAFAGIDGVPITRPHANLEDLITATPVGITDGSSTSIISAAGSGVKIYLTACTVSNSGSTGVTVDLRDGTGGAVKWTIPAAATFGGAHITWPDGLAFTANTPVAADPSGSSTTVTVSCEGFKSKI